jgi:hypothetical protein
MQGAVDDAFQVAGPWRTGVDPVVDVDPRLGRAVVGVHGEPVASIAHGNAFRAVEGGEIVIGQLPHHTVYRRAVERFDGRHTALVDQPVVVGEHRGPGIDRPRAPARHLPNAQVRPVGEIGMTGLHQLP